MALYWLTLRRNRKNRDEGAGQMWGVLHKNRWWHKGIEVVAVMNTRCNLHCDYCPMFLSDNKYPRFEECTLEEWKKWFETFPEWISQVFISGGEPTLFPWISDFVNWLVEREHHVVVLTNLYKVENLFGLKKSFKLVVFPTYHHSDNAERYEKAVKMLKEKTGVEIRSQELEKNHKFSFSVHKNFYPKDWFKHWNVIPHFAPDTPRTWKIFLGVHKTYMEGKDVLQNKI